MYIRKSVWKTNKQTNKQTQLKIKENCVLPLQTSKDANQKVTIKNEENQATKKIEKKN